MSFLRNLPRDDDDSGNIRDDILRGLRDVLRRGGRNGGDNRSTAERFGFEPFEFTPTQFGGFTGSPDLFLGNAPWVVSRAPDAQNELRLRQVSENVVRFDLLIRTLAGGLDTPVIEIAPGFVANTVSRSEAETRFPRALGLLSLRETDTAAGKLMGNAENLAVASVPSETRAPIAGGGDTANQALFRLEDDNGDIQVTPLIYDPGTGTPVISLATGKIAGDATDILIVGRKDAVAQILSGFGGPVTISEDFTEDGTWDVPAGVSMLDSIEVRGSGAGGGGVNTGGVTTSAGGGGGAGAYNRAENVPVTPADTLSLVVPVGGTGGVGNSSGNSGSTASVTDGVGPTLLASAPGGSPGQGAGAGSNGAGGAGALASGGTGDVGFNGGAGAAGSGSGGSRVGGGGGGSPGDTENGGDASNQTGGTGGEDGGADGADGASQSNDGASGNVPGAGGSGAAAFNDIRDGGDGARAHVRITYTTPGSDTPAVQPMHANTANLWGAIMAPVNSATPGAQTLLLYAGTSMYTLSTTANVGDAPTEVLTNLPEGGYAIGILQFPGLDARAFWWMPNSDEDVSGLSRNDGGYIMSTNLEGDVPQQLDMGLSVVMHAMAWRDGVVATDGQSVVWHNGVKNNLGALENRIKALNRQISILQLMVENDRLFAYMQERASLNVTRVWIEEYILEEDEWHTLTKPVVTGSTFRAPLVLSGQTAIYKDFDRGLGNLAHRMYWYDLGEMEGWQSITMLPSTLNPFYAQSTSSEGVHKYESEAVVESPEYIFAGMEPYQKIVSDIWFGGSFPATPNQDGSVTVTIAGQTNSVMQFPPAGSGVRATFTEGTDWKNYIARDPINTSAFQRLKFRITGRQGTGLNAERTMGNYLPVMVGGYIILNDAVESPNQTESRNL